MDGSIGHRVRINDEVESSIFVKECKQITNLSETMQILLHSSAK